MTKGTLLKKTKNELADMLIKSQKDYARIKNEYEDVCDKYATCIAENDKYVEENSLRKRIIVISPQDELEGRL